MSVRYTVQGPYTENFPGFLLHLVGITGHLIALICILGIDLVHGSHCTDLASDLIALISSAIFVISCTGLIALISALQCIAVYSSA